MIIYLYVIKKPKPPKELHVKFLYEESYRFNFRKNQFVKQEKNHIITSVDKPFIDLKTGKEID